MTFGKCLCAPFLILSALLGGSCGLVSCKTDTPLFSPNPHSSLGTSTSRSQTNAVVVDAYFPDLSTPKDFVVSIDHAQINMEI